MVVLLAVLLRPREPEYQGKALNYWVKEMQNLNDDRAARQAVHQIGPRGIPFLMSAAAREDSVLRRWYRDAWPHLPGIIQRRLHKPDDRTQELRRIAYAYAEIGPPAIPPLTRMFADRDSGVRVNAFIGLARMRGDKSQAVPALIAALRIGDTVETRNPCAPTGIQRLAAAALGQIGPRAMAAVPDLSRWLDHDDAYTREQATIALWQITGGRKHLASLIQELKNAHDRETIDRLVAEFGDLGAGAIPALPVIREKFLGKNVDGSFLDAVGKIDPDAAYKFH